MQLGTQIIHTSKTCWKNISHKLFNFFSGFTDDQQAESPIDFSFSREMVGQ